jgi:hypothetical protein
MQSMEIQRTPYVFPITTTTNSALLEFFLTDEAGSVSKALITMRVVVRAYMLYSPLSAILRFGSAEAIKNVTRPHL